MRRLVEALAAGCVGAFALGAAHADVIVGTGQPSATTLGQTTATQIRVDSEGTGHGLILPYYTMQDKTATLITIINTDFQNGKVVKLRLRGAGNGDALASMLVMLSPGDKFSGSLAWDGAGQPVFTKSSDDVSCTVPNIALFETVKLQPNRLGASYSAAERTSQMSEGLLEVINVADIPDARIYGASRDAESELYRAIWYINSTPPPCGVPVNRLLSENFTSESAAAELGLAAPTGGLAGRWLIVNVPRTLSFSGSMHAVRAVDANGNDARANFVLFPQSDAVVPVERVDGLTADPLLRTQAFPGKGAQGNPTQAATTAPVVQALHSDFPDFSTPYTVAPGPGAALTQATQFTAAMAVKTAANEHLMEPSVDFRTDWVLSLPSRRFSVAMDHTAAEPRLLYSMVPSTGNQYFHDVNMGVSDTDRNVACLVMSRAPVVRDRDGKPDPEPVVSVPLPRLHRAACGAVSVFSFTSEVTAQISPQPSVLSSLATRMPSNMIVARGVEGWTTLNFFSAPTNLGLPVLAGAFTSAFNPAAKPGVAGNYGTNSEHQYTR
jgi:hypothetical protein